MIKYLKTSLVFDSVTLQNEFRSHQDNNWKSHYNKSQYEGDWTILPLRSINGNPHNVISTHILPKGLSYQNTPLLKQCPYIQSVIESFKCEKTSIRLMKLNAGARIKEHTDHDMNMEAGEARFHIPVQTNKDVAFYIMEDRIPMSAGECWYLNLSLPHKVHNAGSEDRIHLVIDCVVNDWVKALLTEKGIIRKDIDKMPEPRAAATKRNNIESPGSPINLADKAKIIAELRSMNTNAALQLADSMEKEPD
ncbi:aspartyl/asparaginyl beta-hydroxylase domain-containing protein [Taibaiella lutea]|uniref:Aspartyl/asparaginyl beta-hydroxylase domain-containing protein n=1 Tax=Taibaiella lutea TaxID=2608001 RepID=A0A5M6CMM4_9BACT|nr:aspartyl/asparaginyl beta-hydroxylase domain-containing protein [Taibaiella lutea]KAA5536461.1 aspartyl/asparaginyl beta-hydroxylase domain-containing protein [Taibaiella lutea]